MRNFDKAGPEYVDKARPEYVEYVYICIPRKIARRETEILKIFLFWLSVVVLNNNNNKNERKKLKFVGLWCGFMG